MGDKELCMELLHADDEQVVIRLLQDAGYWDDPKVWRYYGDEETNFSTIGNQSGVPEAALVEKLVNSVDARLMCECMLQGIDPTDQQNAPTSITEAVAKFFGSEAENGSKRMGLVKNWSDSKRTEVARGISLAVTGNKPPQYPCITITDKGEGQTPLRLPDTILSLNKKNKFNVNFVQGKFNMGGSGVLVFCGFRHLQLVITRRHPDILHFDSDSSQIHNSWSFTIVRREPESEVNQRSSVYTYLAPINSSSKPMRGDVLHFSSEKLPIFPDGNKPYSTNSEWGTCIKLYNYELTGKSHILRKGGLLPRVDLLLPDVALPIRFHECRAYGGHSGSFDTTVTGLKVRLEDDKGENLESGFPMGIPMSVFGQDMSLTIYAFKKAIADRFKRSEGIIFSVNGQKHGHLTRDFFTRKKVRLSYIADSILIIADCSEMTNFYREKLFKNSRDRLSKGDFRREIEKCLEDELRKHEPLQELRAKRKDEQINDRLDDSKPLADILGHILKKSPSLSNLFLKGIRIPTPFKSTKVSSNNIEKEWKRYPTYFKFKNKDYGEHLERDCPLDVRARILFETDAESMYFTRSNNKGEFQLIYINGEGENRVLTRSLPIANGVATLSLSLPDNAKPGDIFNYRLSVNDVSQIEPFVNEFTIKVMPRQTKSKDSGPTSHREPPGSQEGKEREKDAAVELPNIREVYEADWPEFSFDKYAAMAIRYDGEVYDYYINIDNIYLLNEIKSTNIEPKLVKAQFKFGMVLLGMALIKDHDSQNKNSDTDGNDDSDEDINDANIERKIMEYSRAVAPVIIPIIESLGALSEEEVIAVSASGEDT